MTWCLVENSDSSPRNFHYFRTSVMYILDKNNDDRWLKGATIVSRWWPRWRPRKHSQGCDLPLNGTFNVNEAHDATFFDEIDAEFRCLAERRTR